MRTKHKIKAFTLLESLITILLISIIIGLSYGLINLVDKQMTLLQKENVEVLEYNLFNSTLKLDIHKSNAFFIEKNQLNLSNYDNRVISYSFYNEYILRENAVKIDTFMLSNFGFKFNEGIICCPETGQLNLKVKLLLDTINVKYLLHKNSSQLINKRLFNEN